MAIYCLLLVQVLLLISVPGMLSQVPYEKAFQKEAMNRREYVYVFTDRSMYAVNERIFFRSFYRTEQGNSDEAWSKVLYVELVSSDGTAVAQGKYPLDHRGGTGSLAIPGEALTGTYYLRAYTRWMRNFGPQSFFYMPLKIINPFNRELMDERDETTPVLSRKGNRSLPGILCQTSKPGYSKGEMVRLECSIKGSADSLPEKYCLTLVPAGLTDTTCTFMEPGDKVNDINFRFNYLPDIHGISLSGRVINTATGSAVPKDRLHFSLLGPKPAYLATVSDESGRFILTLPDRTGLQELFVAYQSSEEIQKEILIDQDFASGQLPIEIKPFTLNPEEKEAATRMAVNMQLSRAFMP